MKISFVNGRAPAELALVDVGSALCPYTPVSAPKSLSADVPIQPSKIDEYVVSYRIYIYIESEASLTQKTSDGAYAFGSGASLLLHFEKRNDVAVTLI